MSDVASQLLEFPPEIASDTKLTAEEYDKRINYFLKMTLGNISSNKLSAADKDQDLLQVRRKLHTKAFPLSRLLTYLDPRSSRQQSIIHLRTPKPSLRAFRQSQTEPLTSYNHACS